MPGVPTLLWDAYSIALRIAYPEMKADVGLATDDAEDEEGGEGIALEGLLLLLLLCTGLAPLRWKAPLL